MVVVRVVAAVAVCLLIGACDAQQGVTYGPPNMLAFYDGPCPSGWDDVTKTQGQLLLSTVDPERAGISTDDIGGAGWRLENQQQPSHSHDYERKMCATRGLTPFPDPQGTQVAVIFKEEFNVVDQMNCDGSANDASDISSDTTPFPFAQLRVCKSGGATTVPVGTVAYFMDDDLRGCPDGWSPFTEGNGRFLQPKDTLANPTAGNVANAGTSLDTSAAQNLAHRHAFSFTANLGKETKKAEGSVLSPIFPDSSGGQDFLAFTAVSDASGLNLPYEQVLTCKATLSTGTEQLNPPAGALMFFDDSATNSCNDKWQEAESGWRSRLLVALPSGESPTIWSGTSSSDLGLRHTHSGTYSMKAALRDATVLLSNPASGDGRIEYSKSSQTFSGQVTSTNGYAAEWTACPSSGQCNVGGGKVLARFGVFDAGSGGVTASSSGQNKFNYVEIDGAFTCDASTFQGDPTIGGSPSCSFALPISEVLPALGVRFCKSTGFTGETSDAPTPSPTRTGSPTRAPVASGCSFADFQAWNGGTQDLLDDSTRSCALSCDVKFDQLASPGKKECLDFCHSERLQLSLGCAVCARKWALCVANSCSNSCNDGSGYAYRTSAPGCAGCTAQKSCDAEFAACSAQGLQVGEYVGPELPTNTQGASSSGGGSSDALIFGGIGAGAAVLFGGTLLVMLRKVKEVSSEDGSSRSRSSKRSSKSSGLGRTSFGRSSWGGRMSRMSWGASSIGSLMSFISASTMHAEKNVASRPQSDVVAMTASSSAKDSLRKGPRVKLRAKYDFEAENEDELHVEMGEELVGIQQDGEWYYVESVRSGKVGLIPVSYAEKLSDSSKKSKDDDEADDIDF